VAVTVTREPLFPEPELSKLGPEELFAALEHLRAVRSIVDRAGARAGRRRQPGQRDRTARETRSPEALGPAGHWPPGRSRRWSRVTPPPARTGM
jgi:hypothetical protein